MTKKKIEGFLCKIFGGIFSNYPVNKISDILFETRNIRFKDSQIDIELHIWGK